MAFTNEHRGPDPPCWAAPLGPNPFFSTKVDQGDLKKQSIFDEVSTLKSWTQLKSNPFQP